MFTRSRLFIGLALLLSFTLVPAVFAGGWAVVVVDDLPVTVATGEPLTIGFTVLQHGKTPASGLTPAITFTLPKEEQFTVFAEGTDKAGHYSAIVTFPREGEWNWSIDAYTFPQAMPVISVAAPVAAVQPVDAKAIPSPILLRVAALAIGLVGLILLFRTKSRIATAFTTVCLVVGVATFIPGVAVPKAEAQNDSPTEVANESSVSQVELGRRLFIAKGCITCHVNSKAAASGYVTIEIGAPNLSTFSASPEALFLRLKDPSSVKSDTQMPNLGLSEAEIEALIAFINSK